VATVLAIALALQSPKNQHLLEPLRRDGHDIRFQDPLEVRSEAALAAALKGVAATLASIEPYTAAVLDQAPELRVIARLGVGYDAIDVPAATRHGVAVCTTPNTNHIAVADMAVTLILACARRLIPADRTVRAGGWGLSGLGRDLRATTVGVVGTGLIGREVVKRLWGFSPTLLAHDVVQNQEVVDRYGVSYVPLDELLERSDFVTLHAPLLPETRGLIGREALRRMKPTAYLVNTARGPLVDEAALVEALREGRLAGAALDVFATEPLAADSPLRQLDNVILTPHIAGVTEESVEAMARMAVENAARVLRGEEPLSCLNPEVLRR
jgi:D-3-phosphoglycerate dehydrogenase / 2-oxoglutarate reductase